MYALVIDDSRAMRRIIGKIMKNLGFEILEACHGLEGLTQLEEHNDEIDIVLVDWNMPEMNGIEFVETVRSSGPVCQSQIDDGDDRNRACSHGESTDGWR